MDRIYILGVIWLLVSITGCTSSSDTDQASEADGIPTHAYDRAQPARVVIIHSYHEGLLWEQELKEGIGEGFADRGFSESAGNLVLDHFWMDTQRQIDEADLAHATDEATAYIQQVQPDVVIICDDNAIQLVMSKWSDNTIPFVFTGLNASHMSYGLPSKGNVTGVLERIHAAEVLKWIEIVLPDARAITVLTDASTTTYAYTNDVMIQLSQSERFRTNFAIHTPHSFADWQDRVFEAGQTSDVLLVGTYQALRGANDQVVDAAAVMAWTVENAAIPVVPFWEYGVQQGALGGPVIAGQIQGYEAALKAVRILYGENPLTIEITAPQRGKLTLNIQAARRWGITFPLDLLETSTIYGPDGTVMDR